jgi:UDP-N-acetylmuramyl pentapeptide phosphotransferase/UDP-N-acetylglucosamine-1-phosphate transferase
MMTAIHGPPELSLIAAVSAVVSAGLILVLRPALARYALARPNARSSHKVPTPQGGGIAVIAATLGVSMGAALMSDVERSVAVQIDLIFTATAVLAIAGAIDDIVVLGARPKLLIQLLPVLVIVAALPLDARILPAVPWWIERAGLLFAGLWFVNLVNFMDGIDWMTVAEVVPVSAGLVLLGLLRGLPAPDTTIAAALLGGIIGFAPFNRPVARLFLGDVGSLPIGLILFWLLVEAAAHGHLAAALLLPLYYLADATITLLRRLARGERITQAHRSHFYQIATERGFSVPQVIARVFGVNVGLLGLALASVWGGSTIIDIAALVLGAGLVGLLLCALRRGRA